MSAGMVAGEERASAARMYDYMLGGGHNFAVDREQVETIVASRPETIRLAWETRAYLRRVVGWCVAAGIDQFLDLGSGVPTVGNVHEIAQRTVPHARVAYVDHEAVAAATGGELVAELPTVSFTQADLRDAQTVLAAPGVAGLLNFDRPVAVLALAVLHFVPDDVTEALAPYRRRLAPGSVLAIGHASHDHDDAAVSMGLGMIARMYEDTADPPTLRSRAELTSLFTGLVVEPPGLIDIVDWPTSRSDVPRTGAYGAIGRVPDNPPSEERH